MSGLSGQDPGAVAVAAGGAADGTVAGGQGPSLVLKLGAFEGPLDLLLHLIRSQKLDIVAIPIALVTEQYLHCLDLMRELEIDLAADWLVMAATLLHIKSRMLLPAPPPAEDGTEEEDPRAELARRLVEYERFKAAAGALASRDQLGRDVFARTFPSPDLADPTIADTGPRPFEPASLFDLVFAFSRALANRPRVTVHEVELDRITLADKIAELMDRLAERNSLGFDELYGPTASRAEVVVSFLAVLELVRMKVIRACQAGPFGPIRLFARVATPAAEPNGDAGAETAATPGADAPGAGAARDAREPGSPPAPRGESGVEAKDGEGGGQPAGRPGETGGGTRLGPL